MPRVDIPVQQIPYQGSITDIAYTAGDAANNHEVKNSGSLLLLVKNGDGSPHTVTAISVPDSLGRTQDEAVTVAAGKEAVMGPFLKSAWNQAGTGLLNVDIDVSTGMEITAIQLPAGR